MKHLEVRQKYSVARRILNSLQLDILHHLFSLVSSLFYNLVFGASTGYHFHTDCYACTLRPRYNQRYFYNKNHKGLGNANKHILIKKVKRLRNLTCTSVVLVNVNCSLDVFLILPSLILPSFTSIRSVWLSKPLPLNFFSPRKVHISKC